VPAGGSVPRNVTFTEVTYVAYGRHDSGPAIVVGMNDQSRATLERLVDGAGVPVGRVPDAAYQAQNTKVAIKIPL
jgi:hypothetical protein